MLPIYGRARVTTKECSEHSTTPTKMALYSSELRISYKLVYYVLRKESLVHTVCAHFSIQPPSYQLDGILGCTSSLWSQYKICA